MSIFSYKKFKVALKADSKKVQGLHVGDIVRRQYFDSPNIIYSLMCVLEIGTDEQDQKYFIGALLEGDEPKTTELLDFARVTNLFDTDRSGALYLTSNDSESPYMDVIDGIGRNASLNWPTGLQIPSNEDSQSQYILEDASLATSQYIKWLDGNSRVLHLTRNDAAGTLTLKQDFYKYVANPNRVLISYKVKASRAMSATASLEYVDGVRVDGMTSVNVGTDWSYQLHVVTVEWSGRHLRTVKMAFPDMADGDEVWIADFNIILLSSVANFADASQTRVGKLDGIVDPVFGKLNGYGGYLQKMFSSGSAHVSGTLTAGDENGFGATFYAGKIHRNAFVNSLSPDFVSDEHVVEDSLAVKPTGIGGVYKINGETGVRAQSRNWLRSHIGKRYCFSFWAFANNPCQIAVKQNGYVVGTLQIESHETHTWQRQSISFEVLEPENSLEGLIIGLVPAFSPEVADAISSDQTIIQADTQVVYEDALLFSAPQLESGNMVTQYQATDDVLSETEDYGAWFSRGGIGGTIQNPLLQLNYDGEGSIGTRTRSFLLKVDGSGYFAKTNIRWDENGHVTFGSDVTLDWSNLSATAQKEIVSKSVKIVGNDTLVVVKGGNAGLDAYSPSSLTFGLNYFNFTEAEATYQWQYKSEGNWEDIPGATQPVLEILPGSDLWSADDTIQIRICATIKGVVISDFMTLRKMFVTGYTVEVTSDNGTSFHNGSCQTILRAQLYYRGTPVNDDRKFVYQWHKYRLPDVEHEDLEWFQENGIDRNAQVIVLDYTLDSQDYFVCTVSTTDMFTYDFPISF